ncbi:hypothetical protein [Pleomorphomonas diazotrophica]|uniref:magnesium chelatase subunit ChlI family protein n=1 Tax=Pleomorphomonas diazotrophica TaxID=1166257 RepID=UPI002452CBC4|nr:hypothetical protein [Pleomorphomonas diazotrophica]
MHGFATVPTGSPRHLPPTLRLLQRHGLARGRWTWPALVSASSRVVRFSRRTLSCDLSALISGRRREPDRADLSLLKQAAERLSLSARGYHRVLRVARALAGLDGAAEVSCLHVGEALAYRTGPDRRARAA